MKSIKKRLANSIALAMTVLWILCSAIVWILPGFSLLVTNWWTHGMDLSAMRSRNLTFGTFVWGGIAAIASAWDTGWILGWNWEIVEKK